MKKLLLFALLLSVVGGYAQRGHPSLKPHKARLNQQFSIEKHPGHPVAHDLNKYAIKKPFKSEQDLTIVNPVPIGQSGNAFGFAFFRTTYLWADNNINAVTFIHRMVTPPGSGYLAYDISKDGGLTWTNNVQAYDPLLEDAYDGRYPQGAIYNPSGNTDPDLAYFHYFAPTLDGSNTGGGTNWGGYAYGVKKLEEGSVPTQHNRTSTPPYYQYLPSAFTVTQTGDAWMVDENAQGNSSDYDYLGELIVGRGLWNEGTADFDYYFDQMPLEVDPDDGINDIKVAFAPDGLTGYICVMTNPVVNLPYTSYHPVLFKTTDGGDSWSEPIEVQLGGEDGLAPIREFISDSMLSLYYDPLPVPPRDEVAYYMGYECDLAVDAWGNPHLAGMVCITDLEQGLIYTAPGLFAMFHIWSDDQGLTWQAFNLADLNQFDAEFVNGEATITQYNRPQVATTMDGALVFFSWLDTENPVAADNSMPDIYFREYIPSMDYHGEEAVNVTFLSAGMWSAYFGCMSHYVFSDVFENTYTCTIPFVYTQLTNSDPTLPASFFYIPDFNRTYTVTGIDKPETEDPDKAVQNYPNPFTGRTSFRLSLDGNNPVSLHVFDLTGKMVTRVDYGTMSAGTHEIEFLANELTQGIYFYSLGIGPEIFTGKLMIRQ